MLVTVVVICVFPLLESLSAIHPAPTPQPVAIPVKLAATPQSSSSLPRQTAAAIPYKSSKTVAMALPKPLPSPPKTPVIQLPPKPSPIPLKTVDITPQPTVQPDTTVLLPQHQPIADTIQQQAETTVLDTIDATSEDGNRATAPSLLVTSDEALPDGKALKHPPVILTQVSPRYPEYSRRLNMEGFVILRFIVDINGRVMDPVIHESSPAGHFDNAALRAIRQWRFSPGRDDDGTPLPCRLQIRIEFKLENSH